MIKVLFVLVIIAFRGGVNTDLKFDTLEKCEMAGKIVSDHTSVYTKCIEIQEKPKKLKCKVKNNFGYYNNHTSVMNYYPYPESYECIEE